MHSIAVPPAQEEAASGFVAYGPNGEIEFGLRYQVSPHIPEQPVAHIEGCASPAKDCVAFSLPSLGLVRLVETASGREVRTWNLAGAGKLWSDGEGEVLVARPEHGDVVRLSLADNSCERIPCSGLSPVHAARWGRDLLVVDREAPGVFLLAQCGSRCRIDVRERLLAPTAAVPACEHTFLLSDRDAHLAARITRDGRVLWRFGAFEEPSSHTDRLANPEHVCQIGPRRFAITDMRNSRIVLLDEAGACVGILGSTENIGGTDGALWAPTATAPSSNGLIVADAGNGRLIERRLSLPDRDIVGRARVAASLLHHPRSATTVGADLLIADCYHDRVVRLTRAGLPVSTITAARNRRLFWPRSTACIAGDVMISDGRNRRVLRIGREGDERELRLNAAGGELPFRDPHSIREAGGNLLITDTDHASVFLVEPSGRLLFAWGPNPPIGVPGLEVDLSDVHDAWFDPRFGIWIADTGNNRLVLVDGQPVAEPDAPASKVLRVLSGSNLSAPRSIETTPDELLLVCDSDNHRVLLLDPHGEILFVYGGCFGHALDHLAHPRIATLQGRRLLVADCINNRILDLPLSALRGVTGDRPYRDSDA